LALILKDHLVDGFALAHGKENRGLLQKGARILPVPGRATLGRSRPAPYNARSYSNHPTHAMAKKLYIETHGCQMNEYDSSRMVDLLGEHQALEVTENPAEADVILLNTCSIREKAQEKVFSQLGRWRELKDGNPDLVIGVGGCVASQEGAAIRYRAPYVDVVFG